MDHRCAGEAYASNSQASMQAAMSSSQVSAFNRPPETTLSDLIDRAMGANKTAIHRAEMAERLADLLCGEAADPCGSAGGAPSPMALIPRLENELMDGERIGARIDTALHRIARRLSADKF